MCYRSGRLTASALGTVLQENSKACQTNKLGVRWYVHHARSFGLHHKFSCIQEVNFFGLIDVTRKAIQVMRDLETGGIIQQVTSIGGQKGVPVLSIYCASKWAVEVCIIFIEHFNRMKS